MLFQELTDLTSSIEPLAYAHKPKGVQKSSSCSVHSFHKNGKQPAFPATMMVSTHQFMVANRFVASRKHLGNPIKKLPWQSLLARLDLHETSELSRKQKTYLGKVTTRLDRYLNTRAIEWKAAGIYLQSTNGAVLAFHECARAWLRRDLGRCDGISSAFDYRTFVRSYGCEPERI